MLKLLTIICALSSSVAWGQARIAGVTSASAGDRIVLVAASDAAKPSYAWFSSTEDLTAIDYEVFDSGSKCAVWAKRPGLYGFTLLVITKDAAGDPVVAQVRHRLEIVGPGPAPPPVPPNPPTPPVPPSPVDKWGLIRIARETAPVNTDERAKVKANFSAVASQLAAGGFQNVAAARTKLAELNRAAVGPVTETHPWNRFFMSVGTAMDAAEKAGTVKATGDYVQAWGDISQGL